MRKGEFLAHSRSLVDLVVDEFGRSDRRNPIRIQRSRSPVRTSAPPLSTTHPTAPVSQPAATQPPSREASSSNRSATPAAVTPCPVALRTQSRRRASAPQHGPLHEEEQYNLNHGSDAASRNFLIDSARDELLRIIEWQIEDLAVSQLSICRLHGKLSACP